ncbi:MAG TPA: putative selenate ABC transporter substrate-binding protein [Candidatus Binatia bacterium]|nr:putative selenate ABC transporter substrate-binding protein [Candidatus Binatia bacterium]
MKRKTASTLLLLPLLFAIGCKNHNSASEKVLRVAMIPSTDPGKIVRESQPLVDYLQKETGARVELVVPTNYAAVVEAIANGQVDIAYLGGFTFVQASRRAGVQPLVQRERDQNFHSVFITQPNSRINSLADLKGRTFAFGDVNSTSGHLMPAYFMRAAGVDPSALAKTVYSGGHDATALAVANAKVDAGAMDELVFGNMMKAGKITPAQVRVFFTTPPFFDYVWVARQSIDPELRDGFARAFLGLDASKAEHKALLDLLNATRYVRADGANYDKLRQAARDEGLLQ